MPPKIQPNIYASCLSEMSKTYRAAHFYPKDHPALSKSVSRSYMYLKNLLKVESPLIFTITKSNFLRENKPVPVQTHVIKDLAYAIFRRRMKVLHFESDTSEREFFNLFQVLLTEPDVVEAGGGPERLLASAGVINIWCNEIRFSKAEVLDEEAAEGEEYGDGPPELEDDPLAVLMQISASEEARSLLQQVAVIEDPKLLAPKLEELVATTKREAEGASPNAAVSIISILMKVADQRSEPIKGWLHQAIRALVSPAVLQLLILHSYRSVGSQWLLYKNIFKLIGEPVIPYLLKALMESSHRKERLRTIESVAQFGDVSLPLLLQMMKDERWFAVRNALYIMQQMPQSVPSREVIPMLYHKHDKVRREAAAVLRSIGDKDSFKGLRDAVNVASDSDLRFLLPELSAFPTEWVEDLLIQHLRRGSLTVRSEAADALAILGTTHAMNELAAAFLKKGNVLNRDKTLLFRKAVGERLLAFLPETYGIFEQAKDDPTPVIFKLVQQATAIMRKKSW